jgi:hypothetical protein
MKTEAEKEATTKQPYSEPKLIEHGDVVAITLGNDLGENLDAAFNTSTPSTRGNKKPKKHRFS